MTWGARGHLPADTGPAVGEAPVEGVGRGPLSASGSGVESGEREGTCVG